MSTPPRLLLDEMLSGDIAAQLRSRGHDVIAIVDDPALVGSPDDDVLGYASVSGRCVVTANIRDFVALSRSWLAAKREHGGITYISARAFPQNRAFVGSVVTAIDQAFADGSLPAPNAECFLRSPG